MATIKHNNQNVPVTGNMAELAAVSNLLKNWIQNVSPEFYSLNNIEVQSMDVFHDKVHFLKIKVSVVQPVVGAHDVIVFLRGDAVVLLAVIVFESKKYVLLVNQTRLPIGTMLHEFVAGMLDGEVDARKVMFREVQEEAMLTSVVGISEDDIIPLFDGKKILSSPGIMDEGLYPFYLEKEITDPAVFAKLQGLQGGLAEENEHITVSLVPFTDVLKYCNDAKTLATLYLYEHRND